ncbi:exonuclease subunit SbcD [Rhodocyclus tenuis]|uniref:exonuclease SbcCD subunit D n=1 Tax=Rhodocyclus gracilis TaxID=2929842 RepID=UPI001298C157|nr:exonuclease SbcCD subunit D [Rhodocyclus gracilis]MRD73942.1 exonuclease subunit SbcD [Rhodocyclus gracilis]
MKILHTADWHLGRYLHGLSLLDDQAYLLTQLVALARDEAVDLVIIAGDVYDRAQPPAEAVALLDEVLAQLVMAAGIPVVVIAGNHDSAERIGFVGRICRERGLLLRGTLDDLSPLRLRDAHGEVEIWPVPYVEPVFARALAAADADPVRIDDHAAALALVLARVRTQMSSAARSVLVAHAFVAGASESESERALAVGGSGAVGADLFAGFDYVALGHLHRPQSAGAPQLRYAGSLLKYSFAEAAQEKSVSIVDLPADGVPRVRTVALTPRHDLRIVRGRFADLLQHPDPRGARDDYLCIELDDAEPVLDPMARLRTVYPNLLELRFASLGSGEGAARVAGDHRRQRPEDLFAAFYRDVFATELGDPARAVFADALRKVEAP